MGKKNVASGNDVIAVQVGQVHGRRDTEKQSKPEPTTGPSTNTNVRSGNARVGRQSDVIVGDLRL